MTQLTRTTAYGEPPRRMTLFQSSAANRAALHSLKCGSSAKLSKQRWFRTEHVSLSLTALRISSMSSSASRNL
jgi:hypothetical protein